MQSRKIKREPNLAEATEKTGLFIRGLQSRLLEGAGEVQEQPGDSTANLEKQLQEYFACWPREEGRGASPLNRIRDRAMDGVAEKILHGWQQDGNANPLEHEVTERLIYGVLEMLLASEGGLGRKAMPGDTAASMEKQLREYFKCWPRQESPGAAPLSRIRNHAMDGVAERILRGWQQDGNAPVENDVIERLIDGMFEMLVAKDNGPVRKARSLLAGPKPGTTQLSRSQLQA